jgi:hypothetical protein
MMNFDVSIFIDVFAIKFMQFSANCFKITLFKSWTRALALFLTVFFIPNYAQAKTESFQADSLNSLKSDTAYDTSKKTDFISFGNVVTGMYAYSIVPISVFLGAASISSPTYIMEFDEKYGNHTGYTLGTGIGIDFNEVEGIGFSDFRTQFEYTRLPSHPVSPHRITGTNLIDFNLIPVLRKNVFQLGGSIGLGLTISPEVPRYHAQAEIWLKNAMGLSYLGLFPQHQLFVRGRYTTGLANAEPRYDIAIGYASTISLSVEFFYDFIP